MSPATDIPPNVSKVLERMHRQIMRFYIFAGGLASGLVGVAYHCFR